MILQSMREMDTPFIARTITEMGLDPSPTPGFHADPNYWQETARWQRVVERYSWGCTMFISDRERGSHVTIVCIGRVDLDQGRVSTQGGWDDITQPWYLDMVKDLKTSVKPLNGIEVPPCLGFHQHDHVCDGGENPATKKVEPECAWRSRCCALQTYSVEQGRRPPDVLKGKNPEQIVQITNRLLERQGKAPVKTKQAAKREIARPAPQLPAPGSTTPVVQNVCSVISEVAEAAGLRMSSDYTKNTALPGELYVVDRTQRSDYVSVYKCASKPIAIASFRIRPRLGGFVVQLPIPKTSQLLEGIVPSDVRDWKDGAFQSAVSHVAQEGGTRMEHIKHVLVKLVKG